jgi:hypothetical protein
MAIRAPKISRDLASMRRVSRDRESEKFPVDDIVEIGARERQKYAKPSFFGRSIVEQISRPLITII